MNSVFERLALMRKIVEHFQEETTELVRQAKQREDSSYTRDLVLQLEDVAENLEHAADGMIPDGLHADSCPVHDVQYLRAHVRIQ